jgi:hypothetical protein
MVTIAQGRDRSDLTVGTSAKRELVVEGRGRAETARMVSLNPSERLGARRFLPPPQHGIGHAEPSLSETVLGEGQSRQQ